jgi:glycosidase
MPEFKPVIMEFHVSQQARRFYEFDEAVFTYSGNVIFANFHAARVFAQKMNARRDLINHPEQAVRAGHINAMGLVDEILHLTLDTYRAERNPQVIAQALAWLDSSVGAEKTAQALRLFCEQFPPLPVYKGLMTLDEYLDGKSERRDGTIIPNSEIVLEEMLMLWLANVNPAFSPFQELFDDGALKKSSAYLKMITGLYEFFDTQPPFGQDNQNLIDLLRAPAVNFPDSLMAQLEFMHYRWSAILGSFDFLFRLLSSLDLIKEEEKPVFGFGGQGPALVYEFKGEDYYEEPERFSQDRDWMPNLVLLAKNSYVWLDQLSKKYERPITRLDQIPDEELDALARWGFTGLWLIGLWERSRASQTIKQLRGNPEAVASAYSLFSYDIANDLGGEEAYEALRARAWKRGIRLASDMVPNHMGIDSRWVIEHPDWFVSLDYSPFPTYTFNGPNLSWDNRVGIYLEDHYYNNSDAAVVFKRVDFWTGNEKYVYHGNDGTSMPWNDTAQLNYLMEEVREAVIQTILHVARKFPIIRFDAAMTLAKRHYHRLWFPEPGSGGDIPSRAEYGLTKTQFDEFFPEEFWRQVVDRVAQEAPDTLLLAEAFWLMEGYFVRTLGMHRVYNSAFMNMLRDEKNQEYRLVIKNTIEFDPEILKRYVNFMNNPDERTAVDQFGKGDKYFGICAMMTCMPGLPMFGHGQIEGFNEKYGMEYRRAYWDEQPDDYLVDRHKREIFPLLRRRHLFTNAQNFLLFDFYTPDGYVNEDVYAFVNRAGIERALFVFHNKYASVRGWIRLSAAFPVKTGDGDERVLMQKTLAEGLGISQDPDAFTIFRDSISGLEHLRSSKELREQGLEIELGAYQYHVFMDFREVQDTPDHQYATLAAQLGGRGATSIAEALREMHLQPVHVPFIELVNPGMFQWLIDHRYAAADGSDRKESFAQALDEAQEKMLALLEQVQAMEACAGDPEALALEARQELEQLLGLAALQDSYPLPGSLPYLDAITFLLDGPGEQNALESGSKPVWGVLLCWWVVRALGKLAGSANDRQQSRSWMDELLLGKLCGRALQGMGLEAGAAGRSVDLIQLLVSHSNWRPLAPAKAVKGKPAPQSAYMTLLSDPDLQRFLAVHRYEDVLWFNKEAFDELLWWLFTGMSAEIALKAAVVADRPGPAVLPADAAAPAAAAPTAAAAQTAQEILDRYSIILKLARAEAASEFQFDQLLKALEV